MTEEQVSSVVGKPDDENESAPTDESAIDRAEDLVGGDADVPTDDSCEEVPVLVHAFPAKVIDHGDGTAEIRLMHKGKDIVKTTIPDGILDPLFARARELIDNPIVSSLDDTLNTRESVVAVLRDKNGKRIN